MSWPRGFRGRVGRDPYVRTPVYLALRLAERFGQEPLEFMARLESAGVAAQAVLLAYARLREDEEQVEKGREA